VSAAVRFTAASPCPVCGGHAGLPQGQGRRCWGFLSDDARFAHCTRAEHAGGVPPDPNGESYAHFLAGDCRCGARHLAAPPSPRPTPNGHVASPLSSPPVGGVTPLQPGLTVADLAAAKRLEPALLAAWGVTDARYGPVPHAVRIPYFGQNGEVLAVHFRIALDGDRFRWRSGDKVTPYGLNRLDAVRRRGWALWVEGETDCWSAWLHDLPVLGLPGKSTWQPGWAAYTAGAETYLWQEPGAEDLTARMARTVPDLRVILAPEGVKDLNDAHQQGEDLPALLEELRARAVPADELLRARAGNTAAAVQERAAPVLEAEDPLVLVESALRNQGYGGEIKPGKLTYVAVTSRLLAMRSGAMPVHLLLVGTSGGGKSWTGNVVPRHRRRLATRLDLRRRRPPAPGRRVR
jgi:hypothetical protein